MHQILINLAKTLMTCSDSTFPPQQLVSELVFYILPWQLSTVGKKDHSWASECCFLGSWRLAHCPMSSSPGSPSLWKTGLLLASQSVVLIWVEKENRVCHWRPRICQSSGSQFNCGRKTHYTLDFLLKGGCPPLEKPPGSVSRASTLHLKIIST